MAASTASLPSYQFEPRAAEQRLAHRDRLRSARPAGNFVKNSKSGEVVLKLTGQSDDATLPRYGRGAAIDGLVELAKADNVQSVEVKFEGTLKIKEIAEGGTFSTSLCLSHATLWNKDSSHEGACPSRLSFSLTMPFMFSDGNHEYPLPATFEAHLSGVPGFRANIDYSVTAVVRPSGGKLSLFGGITNTIVSTPLVYNPKTRPAVPPPPPLLYTPTHPADIYSNDWSFFDSVINSKSPRADNIQSRLYVPSSRIFCLHEAIPFYLYFTSSAFSLANFLPFGPTATQSTSSKPPTTTMQLLRQIIVDVRSITKRRPVLPGNKTDIWKVIQIGEGNFRFTGDGHDWVCWSGEITIDPRVTVAGFKASGLTVKDFIVLSVTPQDPGKCPFRELRQVIPVRLTTDPWSGDSLYVDSIQSDHSDPPAPEDLGFNQQL